MGLAPNKFNYESMNIAFNMLLNGSQLIAINKSKYFKSTKGLSLGAGAFVSALEFAAQTESTVVGKPNKEFFLQALQQFGCQPEHAVMIGDVIIWSSIYS